MNSSIIRWKGLVAKDRAGSELVHNWRKLVDFSLECQSIDWARRKNNSLLACLGCLVCEQLNGKPTSWFGADIHIQKYSESRCGGHGDSQPPNAKRRSGWTVGLVALERSDAQLPDIIYAKVMTAIGAVKVQ